MAKNRNKITVTLSKTFVYPISALEEHNPRAHAIDNAKREIDNTFVTMLQNNENRIDLNYFDTETSELTDIQIKESYHNNTVRRGNFRTMIPLNSAVEIIAKYFIEERYGEMNPQTNPKIYTDPANNILNTEVLNDYFALHKKLSLELTKNGRNKYF